jgi:hypothetical protein
MYVLLTVSCLHAQNAQEKVIAEFPGEKDIYAYSFKYDAKHGTYVYSVYDSVKDNYILLSNRGNSAEYGYADVWTVLFDDAGNYLASTYNKITDTTFHYYLLENGEIVTEFDYINEGWTFKDGVLYFSAGQNGKYYFVNYNVSDKKMTTGNPYDAIEFVYFQYMPYEGEPMGEVGFTKDGEPYYLGTLGDEKFLVIGNQEQKHYSDILSFYIIPDMNGELTYFAKGRGKFYQEKGDAFVVQGVKEYDKFDYVYGPLLLDKFNNPVYISGDSAAATYPQRVMVGNTRGRTYDGGIYDIKLSPSGKIVYVGASKPDENKSTLVIDGKPVKTYDYIMFLSFNPDGKPLYAASKGGEKYFAVSGDEESDDKYQTILDLKVVGGKLVYVGANYGDYEKRTPDEYYVHIGENVYGPYNMIQTLDFTTGSCVNFDSKDNYCYTGSRLVDRNKYMYKHRVFTNNWKSKEFDYIPNVNLFKGKPVYTAGMVIDPERYTYNYNIYFGDKEISPGYEEVLDYKFNDNGTITFVGLRDKKFYWVEIRL